jgi:hypothetical protein
MKTGLSSFFSRGQPFEDQTSRTDHLNFIGLPRDRANLATAPVS